MGCNRQTRVFYPVYSNYEVRIISARDVAATGRRLREETDLSQAEAAFITRPEHPMVGWLVFGPKPSPGIIAHEASHAVYGMAARVGATFDEETFAYHLGHLVERIHEFLR